MRKNWVTNWRPYSIPHSAMDCIQRTPDAEPPAVLWLIIGCKVTNKWAKYQIYLSIFERENSNSFAWLVQELRDIVSKVNNSSERAKSIQLFFLLSLLNAFKLIAASFVAPARKVRIRLRPITGVIRGLSVNERIRSFKGWYERQIRTATHTFRQPHLPYISGSTRIIQPAFKRCEVAYPLCISITTGGAGTPLESQDSNPGRSVSMKFLD